MCSDPSNTGAHARLVTAALCGGILAFGISYYLKEKIQEIQERARLNALRTRRQSERVKDLEDLSRKFLLIPQREGILSLPFESLVEKLQRRELSAREVLEAFVAKAITVTRDFNCVTEFIPKCFDWAEELDALPVVKGPLHGVPFCVKEDHDVEGMDTTLGYSVHLYKPKQESAVIVRILKDAGGIPFCKTNLPQTVYSNSSMNPIYGTTLNHLNRALSPGGSSAGTGCLVGAGGALFGTGSDFGGSLRTPSHFSGISTLRSTVGRLSGKGLIQCMEGNAGYTGVTGIMACTARTLAAVYKIAVDDSVQNQYDPLTVPIPWNRQTFESTVPCRIGYYTSLPVHPTVGDTEEVILKVKATLESLGHTVVPFELPDPYRIEEVYVALATADGGNSNYRKLQYDQVSIPAEKFMKGRSILSYVALKVRSMFKRPNRRDFPGDPASQRSEVLWAYLQEQRELKYEVLDRMKQLKLDLILTPVFPFPACKVQDVDIFVGAICYTCPWNLLDFPAGVVPFGTESCTKIDSYNDEGDYYLKLAKEGAKLGKGMPIGVQIVGKPFKEEMVLRILSQLEEYKMQNSSALPLY